GSIVYHQLGATGDLPGYIAVPGSTRPGPPNTDLFVPAWLGEGYAPFCTMGEPRNRDFEVRDLGLPEGITRERVAERQTLRTRIESALRRIEEQPQGAMDQLYGRALELLTSPKVRDAFDVHRERDVAKEKYGRTKIGQRCLLARRLIEAGARFVM